MNDYENISGSRTPLLEVKSVSRQFKNPGGYKVKALNEVSLKIYPGEIYGLVGESGSGKSTLARTIIGLGKPSSGEIIFRGLKLSESLPYRERKKLYAKMQMIFQDPMSSLNPAKKILDIIAEGPDINHYFRSGKERERAVLEALEQVGLPSDAVFRFPRQFSGGQRQRIGIARALIMKPDLILADEPIASLDTSVQAQIVNLMKAIQAGTGMSFLFIAHDLSMVRYISDRIGVMYKGYMVEEGKAEEVFSDPVHPYTRSLLASIPVANPLAHRLQKMEECIYDDLDYEAGTIQKISEDHWVRGQDEEVKNWLKKGNKQQTLI